MNRQNDSTGKRLSRRQFLRIGAAVAGVAAFGGGVIGCSPAATPTEAEPQVATEPTQTPKPEPTPTSPPTKEPVTLTFWCYPFWTGMTGTETGPQYTTYDYPNAKAKEFMEMHPEATVVIEPVDFDSGKEKVEVAALAGNLPTLMYEDFAVLRKRATRELLEPVDDFLTDEDKEDYMFLDVCMYKGERYAFPIRANAGPFFVNRALFEEREALNLLPQNEERDWTWDEFLEAAQALTFDRNGDGKNDVYGFGMHYSGDPGGYHRTLFMWNHGARIFSEDGSECIINSSEGVMGLEFLLELQDKYDVLMPGGLSLDRGGMREAFMQSRAAMYPDNGDLKSKVQLAIDDGKVDGAGIDVWPILAPHLPDVELVMFSDQAGYQVFKQEDPDTLAMAMEFCRFMTSKENLVYQKATQVFPARWSLMNLYEGDEYMDFLATIVPHSGSKDTGHPYYFDYRHLETFAYQAVLTHEKTPKDALDELVAETNKVLKEAGLQS
jgi:multiple sugar transport system substrate-binding protein